MILIDSFIFQMRTLLEIVQKNYCQAMLPPVRTQGGESRSISEDIGFIGPLYGLSSVVEVSSP